LNISDWAEVTNDMLLSIKHMSGLLSRYGGLLHLINKFLPERNLKKEKTFPQKIEEALLSCVKAAFTEATVLQKFKTTIPSRDDVATEDKITLDIYVPDKKIAFEYQGEEFYHKGKAIFGSPEQLQKEFRAKQQKCKASDINLVEVPYWWNLTPDSIKQLVIQ